MSLELTLLLWSFALAVLYIAAQSLFYRIEYGVIHAGGARDNERAPKSLLTSRAERALRNFLETYAAFIALVVVIELAGRSDGLTVWGSQLYFWARVAYLPAYLSAIPFLRSGIWMVSAIGLVLMFVGAVS
ncbi:hypothetical protein VW29_11575 [Devosia limi DSM 17137]|uniref:Uncharacterized conserved protein, MAPEG superfamily n=1 Tax=Devosia limi DSM 17137 TaxID=1121477 RepID=A0A0F5LPD3_9HYPH|nr:MAPEG family protein [Devosia limi]KKB84205.1 hypothetical protein VW29_10950 [Devosia limi DSM 17137]KKB84310.1 hypothetical protein VW29_11575 [Devosia limi DSM 17137]SHE83964.1 Uncharacterized conserved protein, MAPEG superfamily [Devosia limi DSM 17137]